MATTRLGLPDIASNSSAEVSVNTAHILLDALLCASVLDRDLTAPPGSPVTGNTYLVAGSATGTWLGHDGALATYVTGSGWYFRPPKDGFVVHIVDEGCGSASTHSARRGRLSRRVAAAAERRRRPTTW